MPEARRVQLNRAMRKMPAPLRDELLLDLLVEIDDTDEGGQLGVAVDRVLNGPGRCPVCGRNDSKTVVCAQCRFQQLKTHAKEQIQEIKDAEETTGD